MEFLADESQVAALRTELIQYLNSVKINGMAILAIARLARAASVPPSATIIRQNEKDSHVYFMIAGKTRVIVVEGGEEIDLGFRSAKTMFGEIAFFNDTPATATVVVVGPDPAIVFQLSHKDFREILGNFPEVKETLARIGDMRLIKQFEGFIHYQLFMDMIGWPKDRFAINWSIAGEMELALINGLVKQLPDGARVMEVGDGPGVICEMIAGNRPELADTLFIQATRLEEAIANPSKAQSSDLSRAKELERSFEAIVALQVFNLLDAEELPGQFDIAHRLLVKGGLLMVVRLNLLDIRHPAGTGDSILIFDALENLVNQVWPHAINGKTLVETSFTDADLEPIMEWSPAFCALAISDSLTIPPGLEAEENMLLGVLLDQARTRLFNPDQIHFQWLVWKATQHDFHLENSSQNPDNGFYYQLYRKM